MQYAIVQGNEDGNPVSYLKDSEIENINQLMEDHGITEWIEDFTDPNYWKEGKAMLLKIQPLIPKPVESVVKWEI